jgi:hypothetical protein
MAIAVCIVSSQAPLYKMRIDDGSRIVRRDRMHTADFHGLAASGDFLCHLIYINVYFRQDIFCCNTFVSNDLPLSSRYKY